METTAPVLGLPGSILRKLLQLPLARAQRLLQLLGDLLLLLELGPGLFLRRGPDSFAQLGALAIGIGVLLLHLLHARLGMGEHRRIGASIATILIVHSLWH